MAGWDGDSLAGQMEDADERRLQAAEERKTKLKVKPEDRALAEKLEGLRLSQSRIAQQLSRAHVPAHKQMLERALEKIEGEISILQ